MKIVLLAAAMFLVGCASTPPSQPSDRSKTSTGTNPYNRDVSECERKAALSSAGNKAQVFDSCMAARDDTPKR